MREGFTKSGWKVCAFRLQFELVFFAFLLYIDSHSWRETGKASGKWEVDNVRQRLEFYLGGCGMEPEYIID